MIDRRITRGIGALVTGALVSVALASGACRRGPPPGASIDAGDALPAHAEAASQPYPKRSRAGGIVFMSRNDIWKAREDGSHAQNLTNTPLENDIGFEVGPAWSPDGSKIAFLRIAEQKGAFLLSRMRADGSEVVDIAVIGGSGNRPSWTPDGRIVFARQKGAEGHLYIIDEDGKNEQELTKGPYVDMHPSVSPDGKRVVFTSSRANLSRWTLHTMAIDGSDIRPLLAHGENDVNPSWSPDGRRIAFQRTFAYPDHRIMTVAADGTGERELTHENALDFGPCWSPDGQRLAFSRQTVSKEGAGYNLFTMRADGSDLRQITFTEGREADW